jgi:predicted nuclease with RNAse H fold
MVITAGIDLAAEPKGTALALIDWNNRSGTLIDLRVGVADSVIVPGVSNAEKIGIDCALGWPIEFVDFVSNHNDPDSKSHDVEGDMDWRRRLSYRETDRAVRARTGRWPLSVSTDRLGLTAMRCAGLLGRLEKSGIQIDRSGAGAVVEVYPGATLRVWGFDTAGYRKSIDERKRLLGQILEQADWLDTSAFETLMLESCDAFDAVIAALAGRAALLGLSEPPTQIQMSQARIEGWIALPVGKITELIAPGQE